ncbi:hypothetical protein GCM10027423_41810 [Spirosoma arcticum]
MEISVSGDTTEVPLSENIKFYKILIKNGDKELKSDTFKVADMHYHVTMKPHNEFAQNMYFRKKDQKDPLFCAKKKLSQKIFDNSDNNDHYLLWALRYRKLKVLHNGEYVKPPRICSIDPKAMSEPEEQEKYELLKKLYETKWIKPQSNNNNLFHYSQATLPHLKAGNVKLAFNAISPFEHNLANSRSKRIISRRFKSNSRREWLNTIGGIDKKRKRFFLTHWQNYKNELNLIKNQSQKLNNFGWKLLESGEQLNTDTVSHFIVNVMEGAHSFQDKVFMGHLYLNEKLKEKPQKEKEILEEKIIFAQQVIKEDSLYIYRNFIDTTSNYDYKQLIENPANKNRVQIKEASEIAEASLSDVVMEELKKNIRELKADRDRPVFMVTVSHLSWNGMTGNATALDTKGVGRTLIKRLYRIKASDDKKLLEQWRGLFYTESINQYGKLLIDSLLSKKNGDRRVLIDLKHADYPTRKYFYETVLKNAEFADVPPICSHCGVNGLHEINYSDFVDEYSLIKSSADSVFYPLSLNLYDEEIRTICDKNGIIGIPFEQRVLGGLLKPERKKFICRSLDYFKSDPKYKNFIDAALVYTRDTMPIGMVNPEQLFAVFRNDYLSLEPFIQNLFHIIDNSGKVGESAWKHVCLGTDLDGIIDPIDICPTASQYPHFRKRLTQFIPIFLAMRKLSDSKKSDYDDYFGSSSTAIPLNEAMNFLMYTSLKNFVATHFSK